MSLQPIGYESVSAELCRAVPDATNFIHGIIEDHGEDLVHVTCGNFASEWLRERADTEGIEAKLMDRLVEVLKRMCVSDERVQEVLGLSILPNLVDHPLLAPMLYERLDRCLEEEIDDLRLRKRFVWPPAPESTGD